MLVTMTGSKRAPDRELLLAQHEFPGEYVVKAFGPGTRAFAQAIEACATAVVGDRAEVHERMSRHGARMCVTLTLNVQTVDEVIGVYQRIHEVDELMLIL